MTKKIFTGIVTVSALAMLGCFVLIMGVLYEYFGNQLIDEMKNESIFIAQGVEQSGEEYFNGLSSQENRITWIEEDGTVLYDTNAVASEMGNHADREEVKEAMETGEGSASRYSDTLFEKTVYYAKLLDDGTVIRVSSEQNTVWTILLGILSPIVFVLVAMLVLALLLSSRISKRLVKPINEIDLDAPDITEPYEELAPLLAKINNQNRRIKQQIEEIRKKQDEFNIITENMSEGFLVLDNKTDILSYNSSALRLMGVKETDINKSVLSLNRSESFRKAIELALAGKHNEQPLEFGDSFYHIIANPVYSEQKLTGVILVILDMTEKECREQLRREFTSNVSHELKTPLTTIYGVSDMLMGDLVKPADVKEFARTIKDESGRLITLIEDIINLSQLDEESVPQAHEKIDIYEIADSVVGRLGNMAAAKGVMLRLKGDHAVIEGSYSIMEEMLYNLCDNAIKYNKENGAVRIGVENGEKEVSVTVEDTGIGIPPEHLSRVFERFYRVDKSHSKKIGGTGLGLSIVKHAAGYHGGTVKIESEENVGTKITVTLPKQ